MPYFQGQDNQNVIQLTSLSDEEFRIYHRVSIDQYKILRHTEGSGR